MSPRRHLDDLFSAAYDDELSPIEEARFHAHMQSCAPCAAAYAEFRSTVEALREMPKARMPHVVHLPSTAPVAERAPRPRIGLGWFNLGVVRRFPATAIAGAFVVLLAVTALLHSGSTPTSTPSNPLQGPAADSGQHGVGSRTASPHDVLHLDRRHRRGRAAGKLQPGGSGHQPGAAGGAPHPRRADPAGHGGQARRGVCRAVCPTRVGGQPRGGIGSTSQLARCCRAFQSRS